MNAFVRDSGIGATASAVLSGIALLFAAATAAAATFTVSNVSDAGAGSLRQAIADANGDAASTSLIDFAIPGSGPHTIVLTSQLPSITHSVTIDGFTQAGSVTNTNTPDDGGLNGILQVEVTSGGSNGFSLTVKDGMTLTVQGLAINNMSGAAIQGTIQSGTSKINVYGNYIGTTVDGSAVKGHNGYGVVTGSLGAQIGGTAAWQRNLISGTFEGLQITSTAVVEGNLIGTDASGILAVPNTNYGIVLDFETAQSRIGGTTAVSRNIISGNAGVGLLVEHHYTGAGPVDWRIQGNYIGTDWSGTQRLSNGTGTGSFKSGILVGSNSTADFVPVIGGFDPGEGNLIVYNIGPGISCDSNSIYASFDSQGNVIHHNTRPVRANVDIGPAGRTPNDAGDADTGTNNLQNWPQILSASRFENQLTVTYKVDSATTSSIYPLRIDFYADINGGSGDLIGQDSYAAANAQSPRTVVLTLPAGTKGIPFVAVATDANGYSSEFSPAFDVIFEDDFE